ncbi:MAG TPA: hypothetical protein VFR93_10680 [Candidatus Limnocylindrales bacterium]|nr:hypothetical protein [Candidatus Limnocylindrales bacterium]
MTHEGRRGREVPWSALVVILASVALVAVGVGGRLAGPARSTVSASASPAGTVPASTNAAAVSPVAPGRTAGPLPELPSDPSSVFDVVHDAGATDEVWSEMLGSVPAGDLDLVVACSGPGSIEVGDIARGETITADCDGTRGDRAVQLSAASADVYARASALAAWHVVGLGREIARLPAPSGIATAGGVRPDAIGLPDEAITVVGLGPLDGPATGLLVRGLRPDGSARDLATIPASSFPENASPALLEGRVSVSREGYLAVAFSRDDDGSPNEFAAVFDLVDPAAKATIVGDRSQGFSWSPDGRLAAFSGGGVDVWSPPTGMVTHVEPPAGVRAGGVYGGGNLVWTLANELVAEHDTSGILEPGALTLDGRFVPGVGTVYSATGTERPVSADGRTVSEACESSGPGGFSGCFFAVGHPGREDGVRWNGGLDDAKLADHLWSSTGRALWLLADDQLGEAGRHRLTFALSTSASSSSVVARVTTQELAGQVSIAGATGHDEVIALDLSGDGTTLVETRTGRTATADGVFAGWADSRGFRYPETS